MGYLCSAALAEDQKPEDKKPEPPQIALALPLGVEAGASNHLTLRGLFLTNLPIVTLGGLFQPLEIKVLKLGEAQKIDGYDNRRVGDQRLEVEFTLPVDAPTGTNVTLIATSPDGASKPFPLWIAPAGQFVDEGEPNNGFRAAATVPPGKFIRGGLESPTDVDVFRLVLKVGQKLRAEVVAARLGATLDSSLTLYTHTGAILKSNDDGAGQGRDSLLEFTATVDGDYLLAISGVTEKAGIGSVYLLIVSHQ